ncbi:phosphoribosylformylglycinamidine synthase [Anaerocolumna sp. MB42-C2]|uniref:phosphoribosylformylglycinamidine synthase n=1 Tax=Anaerocolumna sp. MB42-C2 TaxID=3070997 RepID=UPI0027E2081C|nr:phosphoribosylformylglycinamidine synthase [Anaerocolumna sp. MB42-C2]WMJ87362.1 phosphoribosylformylglycinamidine synthase [Anaerocolumna sp. MB42-C2]
MSSVKRIYVEKKNPYAVRAKELFDEIKSYLGMSNLKQVRVLIRYDIENVSDETYRKALGTVFSEPPVDMLYEESFHKEEKDRSFTVMYLPGQFDQRADSAEQCVKLLNEEEDPIIRSATTYVLSGDISEEDFNKIKAYCINPVDSKETDEEKPVTLETIFEEPADVLIFDGFISMPENKLQELYQSLNLAMTFQDFLHIQNYFAKEEKRDPSKTEIRVLDTYWSDHCRHTTFLTELKNIQFEDGFYKEPIYKAYENYLSDREVLYKGREALYKSDKYISLMDIALMAMKKLKADGKLEDMEVSDEINACSIVVPVEIDGKTEEWLVFFKNETHNHPTEIEPFGGAATCLGGAIRDPLSGRGYVYQAMRVTGAADPTVSLKDTLKGKLPQRKIVTGAANGYSSYGNQIGLATGLVDEVYHPNYVAKRMEIGAVMGAAPRKNVIRENSDPGDIIILLGGRTGRDGCGGATGSSKVHTTESIETCGAEVQKGNAPTERKLQRLFRREEVSRLIKKCNDFGAGGVSVAIGELAEGLHIYLDKVPKKYAGLDGTELAISESQERMAVVVDKKDVDGMLTYAEEENLEAVVVAEVTKEPRLVMLWRNQEIVNISRAFLDTNGAHQEAEALITLPRTEENYFNKEDYSNIDIKDKWLQTLRDLNVCSKKGLVEMFDSSIGAATVTMPYGGKYQLTPIQTMIAKLPVLKGNCDTVTMMSYGFDPYLSSWSPYHGAVYAIISSVAKIVAAGGDYKKIRFTFQEYFRRLGNDAKRWGEPLTALLGAFDAQMKLGLPSIGGKDSMSGTFNDIDVPPTLVSFAVNVATIHDVITPELKTPGNVLVKFDIEKDAYDLPVYEQIKKLYDKIQTIAKENVLVSAYALGGHGITEAVSKMAFGNKLGIRLEQGLDKKDLFAPAYGSILAELKEEDLTKLDRINLSYQRIGEVIAQPKFIVDDTEITIDEALSYWTATLEKVFPTRSVLEPEIKNKKIDPYLFDAKSVYIAKNKVAKPKVFIPIFPGTNCEYDSLKAFELAGAKVTATVFKNLNAENIRESVEAFEKGINEAQILMFSGGFSAGDEPDGSGKFIATAFRNDRIKDAVNNLLKKRDGLALGICNGFQALIKLGLVPYGEITPQREDSPTLTTNNIGRHISKSVYTKVVSKKSPWLTGAELGGIYAIPASHGEGRFVANEEWIKKLFANGQVATQYVDMDGNPAMDEDYNPNSSYYAIEGITSPDGRVLGKMAHSERRGHGVAVNIYGEQNQYIFESGVNYYK